MITTKFPVAFMGGAAHTPGRRFVTGLEVGRRRLSLAMSWVLCALIICAWQQCQAQITHQFQYPVLSKIQFSALSMIESGDCDSCRGPSGEVSRYQIMPEVWTNQNFLAIRIEDATHSEIALFVATTIQLGRVKTFISKCHRQPTDFEWYLLWHRPARVMNPKARERDRAERFANLCERMRHEHN